MTISPVIALVTTVLPVGVTSDMSRTLHARLVAVNEGEKRLFVISCILILFSFFSSWRGWQWCSNKAVPQSVPDFLPVFGTGTGAREAGNSAVRKLPPHPFPVFGPGAEGQERLAVVLSESCPPGHCALWWFPQVYYIFPRELSLVMSHFVSASCPLVSFFQGLRQCVLCMYVSVCVSVCACACVHFLARVLTSIISGVDVTVSNCASLICDIFTKVVTPCGAFAQWQWLSGRTFGPLNTFQSCSVAFSSPLTVWMGISCSCSQSQVLGSTFRHRNIQQYLWVAFVLVSLSL